MKIFYYNQKLKYAARELRKNMTQAEKKIWYEFLSKLKPRVHRQRAIGQYIVDFYISKADLVIEIDGDSHFQESANEKDAARTKFLNSLNLKVLRFTNSEVYFSFDSVCEIILKEISERLNHKTPPDTLS